MHWMDQSHIVSDWYSLHVTFNRIHKKECEKLYSGLVFILIFFFQCTVLHTIDGLGLVETTVYKQRITNDERWSKSQQNMKASLRQQTLIKSICIGSEWNTPLFYFLHGNKRLFAGSANIRWLKDGGCTFNCENLRNKREVKVILNQP